MNRGEYVGDDWPVAVVVLTVVLTVVAVIVLVVAMVVVIVVVVVVVVDSCGNRKKFFLTQPWVSYSQTWGSTRPLQVWEYAGGLAPFLGERSSGVQPRWSRSQYLG